MKQFDIPFSYHSPLISRIKADRKLEDKLKKDYSPYLLDFGGLRIFLARHFGFCYGVENAIEIAFRTVTQHPGKRIFLISEMIHNPVVNDDLRMAGISFLQDTSGKQLFPFEDLTGDDIVLIPAFGTTMETEEKLRAKGISIEKYDTTCPFVQKVWNRSEQIAARNYTIIIHGKPEHEETRATFSHAGVSGPSLVIRNMEEAVILGDFIRGDRKPADFEKCFSDRTTSGFDPARDLQRIGVVNQTTMLAADTQSIAEFLRKTMMETHQTGEEHIAERFADTRDTLCYATNDNQTAVYHLLDTPADAAIVIGGYNSSNTSHLVHLCEEKLPTYFISGPENIISENHIRHFDLKAKKEIMTDSFLPDKNEVRILLTSGASCPDAVVEKVIDRITSLRKTAKNVREVLEEISRQS